MTPVKCALGMDWLTNAVKEDSLWTMTCADGIVICRENREVEANLERWMYAFEDKGIRVSRSKKGYNILCV